MRRAILLQLIERFRSKSFLYCCAFAAATARARRPPLRRAISIAEPRPDARYGGNWWRSAGCVKPYCAVPQGPLRSGFVGPNRPTTGTPSAAARCMGPVSPPIKSSGPARQFDKLRNGAGDRFCGAAAGFRDLLRQSAPRRDQNLPVSERQPRQAGEPLRRKKTRGQHFAPHPAPGLRIQNRNPRSASNCSHHFVEPASRGSKGAQSSSGMPATAEIRARFCCAT